jgi:Domain of unknown function (DUF6702)
MTVRSKFRESAAVGALAPRGFARWFAIGVGAALLLSALAVPVRAHPFHGSIAEAEYRRDKQLLEVAMRVHPDDLEAVLSRRAGRRIDLEKAAEADDLARRYLMERFQVRSPAGHGAELNWVGKEVTAKWAWLYFEVPLPDGLSGCRVRNEILMDVVADQVNTMNFQVGERRETLRFTRTASELEFAGDDE